MTTIATDGRCVAADSRCSVHGMVISDSEPKAWEVSPGIICAAAGDSDDAVEFMGWITNSLAGGTLEKPKLSDSFEGILVDTIKGTCRYYCKKLLPTEVKLPFAIGSGMDIAVGAMLAGKHPIEAVKIAMLRNVHTGGDVVCLPKGTVTYKAEVLTGPRPPDFPEVAVSQHNTLCVAYAEFYDAVTSAGFYEDYACDPVEGGIVPFCSITISESNYSHTKDLFARVGALLAGKQDGHTDQDRTEPEST